MERRTIKCLVHTLQNLSGKQIPESKLCNCNTFCEILNAFNELYSCVVTFSGVLGATNVTSSMILTVKDAGGNIISAGSDGKYTLKEGNYTYSATCTGAVAKTDIAFSISNDDEQKGTKSVVISFTAA